MEAAGKEVEAQKECALRSAMQADTHDGGGGGGTVAAPARRRVEEEDNSEAPAVLQRGWDQPRRYLRRAEARDQDFVPGDSSSDSESTFLEGLSDGFVGVEEDRWVGGDPDY